MAEKTKKISTLIESQLPGFISSEYEKFSKFVEKYYEQLESAGNPLDVIHNIDKYRDINYYEKNLLNQSTVLTQNISSSDTSILVDDASSFPKENGYIRIGNEICFYKTRTDIEFLDVSRGVSGNTTLGDLYESSAFVTTEAEQHYTSDEVFNISNLFLYALVKNFESDYLDPFPEKYLKQEVDKRTLIKNIKKFYSAKGTDRSIKFLFNTLISKDSRDIPQVYNPKDYTLKASTSDWITKYSLKVKSLTGDLSSLIGEQIIQKTPTYASAIIDNVVFVGTYGGEDLYELILEPSTINGQFSVTAKTKLSSTLTSSADTDNRINVVSTFGWKKEGSLLIGSEKITFKDKNVNQFIIESRLGTKGTYTAETDVYDYSIITSKNESFIILGVLYNLNVKNALPYSTTGDKIEISSPGFDTKDPIIYDILNNRYRWLLNENNTNPLIPLNSNLQSMISDLIANVSAIYEDDQYYYICSSSYPSHQILKANTVATLKDQKLLKLIRKYPTTVTEIYPTTHRDVGIFVDGTIGLSYKDEDYVEFGKITNINVTNKGTGYQTPPYVLINNQPQKAEAMLSGEVVESIKITTNDIFNAIPTVTITSGRGASVSAVVTQGRVTSLVIDDPGEYYSSPPTVRITDLAGKGRFAEYKAIISFDGKLIGFDKIDEGKFYSKNNIFIEIIPEGKDATATASIVKWVKNRYEKIKSNLDDSNGYIFDNLDENKHQGYARVANPIRLRYALGDNLTGTFNQTTNKIHSPILGFAYDGNPIYGPYGYQDPTDPNSYIVRMQSGYVLNTERNNGPSISNYPLGTFIDDYKWTPSSQVGKTVLDKNNGRFCVTPEYPQGTYAYFITINTSNVPVFPYIIGENFYSLPVDSNYNSLISQDDLPKNIRRLYSDNLSANGSGVIAKIGDVTTGSISSIDVEYSPKSFNVGNRVAFDNTGTGGSDVSAFVSAVKGESITSIKSKNTIVKLDIIENAYLFDGDFIQQQTTNAIGKIVGNVFNDKTVFLEEVNGTFNLQNKISAKNSSNQPVKVISLILDQNCSYTKDAIISLTDGLNESTSVIATGLVLESTSKQNSVKLKVLTGSFIINEEYFLRSSDLNNTPGAKIFSVTSLSENLTPATLLTNIALVKTNAPHNLAINDEVNIDITPNDSITETTYYVRKRKYQEVTVVPFQFEATLRDSGVGRIDVLNAGTNYTSGGYANVELLFLDPSKARNNVGKEGDINNAKASVSVINGKIVTIQITNKGKQYKKGDVLTIKDSRLFNSSSTKQAIIFVDHAGLSSTETTLNLSTVNELSENDTLKIGDEIIKITAVNSSNNTITVQRAVENTTAKDYFDTEYVKIHNGTYRFNQNYYPLGSGANDPSVFEYNNTLNNLILKYSYSTQLPNAISVSNVFYDNSTPRKLVSLQKVSEISDKLEFSKNNQNNFVINPTIDIQKYYSYKFDTSHISMTSTYLDFSASLNQNIFTEEKIVSSIEPGNTGSFVKIKLGFGALIKSNNFDTKKDLKFKNYYYFIVANNVETNSSFLRVIDDSLAGHKSIIYVTENKFVYEINEEPQYQGSGNMSYTTNSKFAVGNIASISINNSGVSYSLLPTVTGVFVTSENDAILEPVYDYITKKIVDVRVIYPGKNYINPQVVVSNLPSNGAIFKAYNVNGEIKGISILNQGNGFEFLPELKVIEGNVKIYANSNTIGVPKNVQLINNGGNFYADNSVLSSYRSSYTLIITNFNDYDFYSGEEIVQTRIVNGISKEIVKARIAKNGSRAGSNLLKLENIQGEFDKSLLIRGKLGNKTAKIKAILYTEFEPDIRSYSDNIGYYASDKGKLSSNIQKITDSFFYQDYSYVIRSKTAINVWRELIKQTTHPAGFKLFGELSVESEGKTNTPTKQNFSEKISILTLNPISVKYISSKQNVTQTILNVSNNNVQRGAGAVSIDTFNNEETLSTNIKLNPSFNGYYDPSTGNIVGNKTFTVIDANNNLPLSLYNEQQIIISIDGVIQEPLTSYTVSGTQITFAMPPLGERIVEGQVVPPQDFIGKSFKFKTNDLNQKYLKKIRNIFQRNGIWLDSANQIKFNKNFIVEETIGYIKEKYPLVKWNRNEDKCKRDIGYILDALEHDLRFGGNSKTVSYAELYYTRGNELNFIQDELIETLEAFEYAVNLCIASIKNWDITFTSQVSIQTNSKIVTVPSTAGIAIGMYVSSGNQFPSNTKVSKILSNTQIELSNSALSGNLDQLTLYFSKINEGTFYDAANQIQKNKLYIQEETIGKIKNDYPLLSIPSDTKCLRDIGYYIDAVVYHLKYGGNKKIVEFGQTYYDNNKLRYINDELQPSLDAYEYSTTLMILAMRNALPAGTFTDVAPISNSNIPQDTNTIKCQEVQSTLNSYYTSVETILTVGKNLVPISQENLPKSGNWTNLTPYSNYNLIDDVPVFNTECQEVVSALSSLYDSIESTLLDGINSVEKSLPDYFDGENTIFELYYEDGSIVKTDEKEKLIVSLNGVLQRPSTDIENNNNSYYILRSPNSSTTDKIVFSAPPKWDQDSGALSLQQASAVEKFFAFSIGSYDQYTIDDTLISYLGKGPYTIISQENRKIKKIDDENYALVFLNGVLQKQGIAYVINGTSITFDQPLNYFVPETGEKIYPKVDIIIPYGRDIAKTATFYDFEKDIYLNEIKIEIQDNSTYNDIISWYRNAGITHKIFVYQQFNNEINPLGLLKRYSIDQNTGKLVLILAGNNDNYNQNYPIIFSSKINNVNREFILNSPVQIYYSQYLARNTSAWIYGTELANKTWKNAASNYANLLEGDLIQIDGENSYRNILKIPNFARSKQFNEKESPSPFEAVEVTNYNDLTRGEGLIVTTNIANGSITKLNWNRRDLTLYFNNIILLQPTAYQYFTAPVLQFIPVDGNGGGAKAEVLTINGQIVDIVLINGGKGYTAPPKVVISRGYNRIKNPARRVDSLSVLGLNRELDLYTTFQVQNQELDLILPSSFLLSSPTDSKRIITNIITFVPESFDINKDDLSIVLNINPYINANSVVSTERPYIMKWIDFGRNIPPVSISSLSKEIVIKPKITFTEIITKNPLASTSDIGAFLDIGLSPTDDIVYIANTKNFPDTGKLLIGKEIVFYSQKLQDRFLNVLRGQLNTQATTHDAGDYLRSITDSVSVIETNKIEIYSQIVVTTVSVSSQVLKSKIKDTISIGIFGQINTNVQLGSELSVGFVDSHDVDRTRYTRTCLGTNLSYFENNIRTVVDFGVANVSGWTDFNKITIEEFSLTYGDLTIGAFDENGTYYDTENGVGRFINTIPSINEYGAFLTQDLLVDSDAISISNTAPFPEKGKLLIGNELIYYAGKTSTSFVGVTRGFRNTPIQEHPIGTYLRSVGGPNQGQKFIKFGDVSVISSPISVTSKVTKIKPVQIIDTFESSTNTVVAEFTKSYTSSYDYLRLGAGAKSFEENVYNDTGAANVSAITLQFFDIYYPNITIQDFENNNGAYVSGIRIDLGIPSINEYGSFLTENITETTTEIFVVNTNGFPDSGTLLLGNELISYSGKTEISLTGLVRGYQNTTASAHQAGEYLHTQGKSALGSKKLVKIRDILIIDNSVSISSDFKTILTVQSNNKLNLNLSTQIRFNYETGFVDSANVNLDKYEYFTLGANISNYQETVNTSDGTANVSGLTIEDFGVYYPNVTIGEFESNNGTYINGGKFDLTMHSINEYGCFLSNNITETTNTINVSNTKGFLSSGTLLIGSELVYYASKTQTTFNGLIRGYNNTQAITHNSGQYIRSIN